MFKDLTIRGKLLLYILSLNIIGIAILVSIIVSRVYSAEKENAQDVSREMAMNYGNIVKTDLDKALISSRSLAYAFAGMKEKGTLTREIAEQSVISVLENNPDFLGMSTLWEPNALDGQDAKYANTPGYDGSGRLIPWFQRSTGRIVREPCVDYEKPGIGDWYLIPKQTKKETIMDPYFYPINGKDVLITTVIAPIIVNNEFLGVVSADYTLTSISEFIASIKPMGAGYSFIVSNNGTLVSHPRTEIVGKPLGDYIGKHKDDVMNGIKTNSIVNYYEKSVATGENSLLYYVPFTIGNTSTSWYLGTVTPIDTALHDAYSIRNYALIISLIILVIIGLIILLVSKNISAIIGNLVLEIENIASAIVHGKLSVRMDSNAINREFRSMSQGVDSIIDSLINPIETMATYIDRIAKGDIPEKITDKYEGDFNIIVNNLNKCIEAVGLLVEDANSLAEAAANNQLETRADANRHSGDYRKVIDGINHTLDSIVEKIYWYGQILDAIPFYVSVTDNNEKWTFFNRAMEKALNISRKRNIGENPVKYHPTLTSSDERLAKGLDKITYEADGQHYTKNFAYLKNNNGVRIGIVDVISEITDLVQISNYNKTEVERLSKNLHLISEGNFSLDKQITEGNNYTKQEYENFRIIYNNLDLVEKAVKRLISDTGKIAQAAADGILDVRADAEAHQGEYKNVVLGLNNAIDSFVSPLKTAADFIATVSRGDAQEEYSYQAKGEFDILRKNMNTLISLLLNIVKDINSLSSSFKNGDLNARLNESRYTGAWVGIMTGINSSLDEALRPITETVSVLKEMAKKNLEVEMRGDYLGDHAVLKDAVNETLMSMNEILTQARQAVEQVATGSQQVADASQALSQGATEQAASLEEISASLQEIGSQTKLNAENAKQASSITHQSQESAKRGNELMNNLKNAMVDITDSSRNISKIIKVIDEIAFQTNLLALNAAVEAARAGRHGKGFAVVAEAVRNLAARSADAAKETAELIEGSIKKVENGSGMTERTAEVLAEIVLGATKATDIVGEIAAASNEQYHGVEQVNTGLHQIEQVTQQTTASAEQSSSAADELSRQSLDLKNTLAQFKLRGNMQIQDVTYKHIERKKETPQSVKPKQIELKRKSKTIDLESDDFGKY